MISDEYADEAVRTGSDARYCFSQLDTQRGVGKVESLLVDAG